MLNLRFVKGRVDRGNFTLSPSQIRTWPSPVIRILSSSRRLKTVPPVGKQVRLTNRNSFQPISCLPSVAFQLSVFPHRPSYQDAIKHIEGPSERWFVVLSIIIYPTSNNWIIQLWQFLYAQVTLTVNAPTSHHLAYPFGCLVAHCRKKTNETLPLSRIGSPRSKVISPRIKLLIWVVFLSVFTPTTDSLRLLWMKFQLALMHPEQLTFALFIKKWSIS